MSSVSQPDHAILPQGQQAARSQDLLGFYRHLCTQTLTVVDVETTGSVATDSRVIEISILQASLQSGIEHQETHLINPSVFVPAKITQFTGITQGMVDAGSAPADVWLSLLDQLNTGILTAHHLAFDYAFIQAEYQRLNCSFQRPIGERFCTVLLSRLLLADLPSRSLPKLVQEFNFEVETSHRAEADTIACWLLAKYLLCQIQNEADEDLLDRFQQQWIRLQDAAQILNQTPDQAILTLERMGISPRRSRSGRSLMYRRGTVETLVVSEPKLCQDEAMNWKQDSP
jgi:DNA polymerase III subunit epsilon